MAIDNLFYDTSGQISELTVLAWVNVPSDGGDWSIFDFDASEYYQVVVQDSDGAVSFSGDFGNTSSNTTVNDGTWHHIGVVYDGSLTNDTKIYVDGSLDVEVNNNSGGFGSGTTRYGIIGDGSEAGTFDGGNNGFFFEGDISDLKYYEQRLTGTEIQNIYNDES